MTIREKIDYLEAIQDIIESVENKMQWYLERNEDGIMVEPYEDEYKIRNYKALEKVKAVLEKAAC